MYETDLGRERVLICVFLVLSAVCLILEDHKRKGKWTASTCLAHFKPVSAS